MHAKIKIRKFVLEASESLCENLHHRKFPAIRYTDRFYTTGSCKMMFPIRYFVYKLPCLFNNKDQ